MGSIKRLKKEYGDMQRHPSVISYASPTKEEDLYNWRGHIFGADNTPFAGGIFFIDIKFPEDYPFKGPKLKFLTKVYHPNINLEGTISSSHDVFCPSCGIGWSPAMTLIEGMLGLIYIYIYI